MSLIVNGIEVSSVICNGVEITSVICDGIEVFTSNKDVASGLWYAPGSSNIVKVQDIWDSINASRVTNSGGQLVFKNACRINIIYSISAYQNNYYCITQGHIRHNGTALVSLGGIYWNGETIRTSGTKTVDIAAGDTIDFSGCCDYYDDDNDSFLKADIKIEIA